MRSPVLIAVLAAGALGGAPPEPLAYRFDEVKSKVLKAPGGDEAKEVRVSKGDAASGGDLVKTGFWARTVVSVPERKARFEIGASARARLQGDDPGVLLVLEKGRLKAIFDAITDGQPPERRVAAPGALLAVRGTRYGLEVSGSGEVLLAVFEGVVEVIPTAAKVPPLLVHADELCTFGPRQAPRREPMRDRGMNEGNWGRQAPQGMDGRSGPGQPGQGPGSGPMGRGPGMGPGTSSPPPGGAPMGGGPKG